MVDRRRLSELLDRGQLDSLNQDELIAAIGIMIQEVSETDSDKRPERRQLLMLTSLVELYSRQSGEQPPDNKPDTRMSEPLDVIVQRGLVVTESIKKQSLNPMALMQVYVACHQLLKDVD